MARLFDLFPTPVMSVAGLADGDLLAQLQKLLKTTERIDNAKFGALSHTVILQPEAKPATQKLARLLLPALEEFGAHLFGEKLHWSVKEMWLNVLLRGGRQATHAHANSFISGVLYLTESHPSANLVFHKPIGSTEFVFSNSHKNSSVGPYNGARWTLPQAGAGDVVLFPSYLLHEVPENLGETRISLAFNALPDRLTSHGYTVRFAR